MAEQEGAGALPAPLGPPEVRYLTMPPLDLGAFTEAMNRVAQATALPASQLRQFAEDMQRIGNARQSGILERERSERRAWSLLKSHLTSKQNRTLKLHRWFDVTGSEGHLYRIEAVRALNVHPACERFGRYRYCLVPSNPMVPLGDVLLGQKLLLETDEGAFLVLAHKAFEYGGPRRCDCPVCMGHNILKHVAGLAHRRRDRML